MLNGRRKQQLQEALCSAFPSKDDLAQMVSFGLDENLDAVAGGNNLRETAFNLIKWALAQGRVDDLVKAAVDANPGNPDLRTYVAEAQPAPAGQGSGPNIIALARVLAMLYEDKGSLKLVCAAVGIAAERVDMDGPILDVWHRVLAEAEKSGQRAALVEFAGKEYPARRDDLAKAGG